MGENVEHREAYVAVCQECNLLGVCGRIYIKDLDREFVWCTGCLAMFTIRILESRLAKKEKA